MEWMSHRKWKETQQPPVTAGPHTRLLLSLSQFPIRHTLYTCNIMVIEEALEKEAEGNTISLGSNIFPIKMFVGWCETVKKVSGRPFRTLVGRSVGRSSDTERTE